MIDAFDQCRIDKDSHRIRGSDGKKQNGKFQSKWILSKYTNQINFTYSVKSMCLTKKHWLLY